MQSLDGLLAFYHEHASIPIPSLVRLGQYLAPPFVDYEISGDIMFLFVGGTIALRQDSNGYFEYASIEEQSNDACLGKGKRIWSSGHANDNKNNNRSVPLKKKNMESSLPMMQNVVFGSWEIVVLPDSSLLIMNAQQRAQKLLVSSFGLEGSPRRSVRWHHSPREGALAAVC